MFNHFFEDFVDGFLASTNRRKSKYATQEPKFSPKITIHTNGVISDSIGFLFTCNSKWH